MDRIRRKGAHSRDLAVGSQTAQADQDAYQNTGWNRHREGQRQTERHDLQYTADGRAIAHN